MGQDIFNIETGIPHSYHNDFYALMHTGVSLLHYARKTLSQKGMGHIESQLMHAAYRPNYLCI